MVDELKNDSRNFTRETINIDPERFLFPKRISYMLDDH
jgi:hypothetical protein